MMMHTTVSLHDEAWEGTREGQTYQDPTTPERKQKLRRCLEQLPLGSRVLDYGCGRGEFTTFLASLGFCACGVDVSSRVIAFNRRDYPEIKFVAIDGSSPAPFPAERFDAIWSSEVIEHVYDVRGVFAEFARLLRPGGRLVLTTPYHGLVKNLAIALFRFDRHFQIDGQHIRFWTRRSLEQVAGENGLRPVLWDTVGRIPCLAKSFFCAFDKPRV